MFGKARPRHWLLGAACLALIECAGPLCAGLVLPTPARAQFDGGYQRRPHRPSFFQQLFGPSFERSYERPSEPRAYPPAEHYDSSRPPPPHKADANAPAPTTNIVVMGDGMADWLAYGLEDAFSDSPDVGITRESKFNSGLLRYEAKSDLDWWHVARDLLAKDKANYVVMMLGVTDRQPIRERDVAKEAAKEAKPDNKGAKNPPDATAAKKPEEQDDEQGAVAAPEPKGKVANGVIEFRSDRWAEIYAKRIDETIAALKSKGVPVFWVGLPSIRGTRSTSEASYLNELYRARAERAGAVYVDVWDGFVDEGGKYSNYGPDYEGQTRRLRSSDGVFFTKYGARKLAHYVEREIRRYMNNRAAPVALPMGPIAPQPKSAVRPLAGPVVPLTVAPGNADQLAGAAAPISVHSDAIASEVLGKGDSLAAPRGRADDFAWPDDNGGKASAPAAAAPPAVPLASAPPAAPAPPAAAPKGAPVKPSTEHKKTSAPRHEPPEKTVQKEKPKQLRPPQAKPQRRPADEDVPRPPAPIGRSSGPFGWIR